MRGDVTDAGQPNDDKQLKIELLSQWKLEAESRKKHLQTSSGQYRDVTSRASIRADKNIIKPKEVASFFQKRAQSGIVVV